MYGCGKKENKVVLDLGFETRAKDTKSLFTKTTEMLARINKVFS